VSVDPRFERSLLGEFALRERRARPREESHGPRALTAAGLTTALRLLPDPGLGA
jgi:hypothetical protein